MILLYIIIGIIIGSLGTLFAVALVKPGSDADKKIELLFSKEVSEDMDNVN